MPETTILKKKTVLTPTMTAAGVPMKEASTATVVTKIKKRKKRNRTILLASGVLVLLIIVLAVVNGGKEKPISVQTETVSHRTITEIVQATGKIQPEVKVKISPEVSGEIVELPVKEGDRVQKGQLIAKIKPVT